MKTLILIVPIIFVVAMKTLSQTKIIIRLSTPGIDSSSSVYITGGNPELGNWNPSAVKLDKQNDGTWEKTFNFNPGESIEFKFTKGSWDSEALNDKGEVPGNYTFEVNNKDTVLNYTITKWKNGSSTSVQNKFNGQITGNVKYIYKMEGEGIKPRDIIVWLPPSYNSDISKRYPVLYMHDGQNIFDPNTATFGVDWQLDESADSLIKAGSIHEIIIIGIYNTADRSAEYSDTKLGHAYMDFIIHTLKPYIDKNFRTLRGRLNTATGGSSSGGLISFMMAWEHPEVFSKAACLSPAFHIDDINYVKNVIAYDSPRKHVKIYIDIGTIGLESRLKPGVDEMINELQENGYKSGTDYEYFIDNGAVHNEAAWSKRNWRYLEFLFKK